jgi:predicted dehydrogenase (TIGR03970 family)
MPVIYDDIIVGGGSSGAVLAARLSEDPSRSVLLLEAGPDFASIEETPADLLDGKNISVVDHDWHFTAEAYPSHDIAYPRGKVTGGSSAVNATVALRGVPADYDEWASLGNPAWAWQNVLAYFRRLEDDQDEGGDLHGKNGPIYIRRWRDEELHPFSRSVNNAFRGLGYPEVSDHNHPESTGCGHYPVNQHNGLRVSTAIGYLVPARHRLNLSIHPHCLVNRVLVEGNRAVGVEVESGGEMQRVEGRRITLSAGAVMSPAILLRSGIGPKSDLTNLGISPIADLPGVGANLLDHPTASLMLLPKPGLCDLTTPQVQTILRTTTPGSDEFNDLQIFAVNQLDMSGLDPDLVKELGTSVFPRIVASLQRPLSKGRLSITSTDPHVQPRLELNYFDHPEDMRRMIEGLRICWQVVQSPEVQELIEGIVGVEGDLSTDEVLEREVRATASTTFHPVGTAKMGPSSDPEAVVDERCRVRGIEGLRVVDASIMPTIVRANTNLTCIMIGERVADWMREEA